MTMAILYCCPCFIHECTPIWRPNPTCSHSFVEGTVHLQNTGANLHCFKNGLHPHWFHSNNKTSTCLLEVSSSHQKYLQPRFSGSCLLTRILFDNPITSLRLWPRNTIIHNCTNTRILAKKSRHMVQMTKKQKRSRYTLTAQTGRLFPISRLWKPHVHCLKERKHKVFSKDRRVSLTTCFLPSSPRGDSTLPLPS